MNKELSPVELLTMVSKSLMLIEKHLRSIRTMIQFFVIVLIVALILQFILAIFSL